MQQFFQQQQQQLQQVRFVKSDFSSQGTGS